MWYKAAYTSSRPQMASLNALVGASLTQTKPSISGAKDPLLIWAAYVVVMLLILVATLYKHLGTGIAADTSYFSLVIAGTFLCSFVYSFFIAARLRREWKGINRLDWTLKNQATADSVAERLSLSIVNLAAPDAAKVKDLVDSYYSTQEVPLRTLSVIAGLMVTLGLIGTILGLIISVSGLESVMTEVGIANKNIFGGVKETIQGMAIAFYATLFGAVLGAVVLRMLSLSLTNSLIKMSCGLFEYLELLPRSFQQQALQASRDVLKPLREMEEQLTGLKVAAVNAKNELEKLAATTLNSRLESISAQLELCVSALKDLKK
jgi:MotA/TolQ/ExbB proton channel family